MIFELPTTGDIKVLRVAGNRCRAIQVAQSKGGDAAARAEAKRCRGQSIVVTR